MRDLWSLAELVLEELHLVGRILKYTARMLSWVGAPIKAEGVGID